MLTTATLAPSKLSAGAGHAPSNTSQRLQTIDRPCLPAGDTTDAAAVSPPSHGSTSPAAAASGDTSIQPAPKACPGGVAASSTLQAANPSYHPPAASSEQPSSQSPAAGPHQQPSAPAGNQQQPPLTFDDLLPLLTSQQRTSSDNSDVLMDLFDAFARHGESDTATAGGTAHLLPALTGAPACLSAHCLSHPTCLTQEVMCNLPPCCHRAAAAVLAMLRYTATQAAAASGRWLETAPASVAPWHA